MPPWFRFYNEAIDDRKLRHIARVTNQPNVTIIGSFFTLCALANGDHVRGALLLDPDTPFTFDELQGEIEQGGMEPETAASILNAFLERQMITYDETSAMYYVTNLRKRNYESDHSTPRVRRFRERQQAECNGDETLQEQPCNGDCNVPETETETDTEHSIAETESEKDNDNAASAASIAPPGGPSPPREALTEGQRKFLHMFGAKRYHTHVARDAVLELERAHGTAALLEYAEWAAKKQLRLGDAIVAGETALPKWGKARASPTVTEDGKRIIEVGR